MTKRVPCPPAPGPLCDGIDDIAVGTPYETVDGVKSTGSAYVMKGGDYGVDLV